LQPLLYHGVAFLLRILRSSTRWVYFKLVRYAARQRVSKTSLKTAARRVIMRLA
jgi:hypothetical protein